MSVRILERNFNERKNCRIQNQLKAICMRLSSKMHILNATFGRSNVIRRNYVISNHSNQQYEISKQATFFLTLFSWIIMLIYAKVSHSNEFQIREDKNVSMLRLCWAWCVNAFYLRLFSSTVSQLGRIKKPLFDCEFNNH